ncbi:unnamed protein product [Auanema sp. JU1783]|nr:unnamed protein product [Auanema sp. JU1783]
MQYWILLSAVCLASAGSYDSQSSGYETAEKYAPVEPPMQATGGDPLAYQGDVAHDPKFVPAPEPVQGVNIDTSKIVVPGVQTVEIPQIQPVHVQQPIGAIQPVFEKPYKPYNDPQAGGFGGLPPVQIPQQHFVVPGVSTPDIAAPKPVLIAQPEAPMKLSFIEPTPPPTYKDSGAIPVNEAYQSAEKVQQYVHVDANGGDQNKYGDDKQPEPAPAPYRRFHRFNKRVMLA